MSISQTISSKNVEGFIDEMIELINTWRQQKTNGNFEIQRGTREIEATYKYVDGRGGDFLIAGAATYPASRTGVIQLLRDLMNDTIQEIHSLEINCVDPESKSRAKEYIKKLSDEALVRRTSLSFEIYLFHKSVGVLKFYPREKSNISTDYTRYEFNHISFETESEAIDYICKSRMMHVFCENPVQFLQSIKTRISNAKGNDVTLVFDNQSWLMYKNNKLTFSDGSNSLEEFIQKMCPQMKTTQTPKDFEILVDCSSENDINQLEEWENYLTRVVVSQGTFGKLIFKNKTNVEQTVSIAYKKINNILHVELIKDSGKFEPWETIQKQFREKIKSALCESKEIIEEKLNLYCKKIITFADGSEGMERVPVENNVRAITSKIEAIRTSLKPNQTAKLIVVLNKQEKYEQELKTRKVRDRERKEKMTGRVLIIKPDTQKIFAEDGGEVSKESLSEWIRLFCPFAKIIERPIVVTCDNIEKTFKKIYALKDELKKETVHEILFILKSNIQQVKLRLTRDGILRDQNDKQIENLQLPTKEGSLRLLSIFNALCNGKFTNQDIEISCEKVEDLDSILKQIKIQTGSIIFKKKNKKSGQIQYRAPYQFETEIELNGTWIPLSESNIKNTLKQAFCTELKLEEQILEISCEAPLNNQIRQIITRIKSISNTLNKLNISEGVLKILLHKKDGSAVETPVLIPREVGLNDEKISEIIEKIKTWLSDQCREIEPLDKTIEVTCNILRRQEIIEYFESKIKDKEGGNTILKFPKNREISIEITRNEITALNKKYSRTREGIIQLFSDLCPLKTTVDIDCSAGLHNNGILIETGIKNVQELMKHPVIANEIATIKLNIRNGVIKNATILVFNDGSIQFEGTSQKTPPTIQNIEQHLAQFCEKQAPPKTCKLEISCTEPNGAEKIFSEAQKCDNLSAVVKNPKGKKITLEFYKENTKVYWRGVKNDRKILIQSKQDIKDILDVICSDQSTQTPSQKSKIYKMAIEIHCDDPIKMEGDIEQVIETLDSVRNGETDYDEGDITAFSQNDAVEVLVKKGEGEYRIKDKEGNNLGSKTNASDLKEFLIQTLCPKPQIQQIPNQPEPEEQKPPRNCEIQMKCGENIIVYSKKIESTLSQCNNLKVVVTRTNNKKVVLEFTRTEKGIFWKGPNKRVEIKSRDAIEEILMLACPDIYEDRWQLDCNNLNKIAETLIKIRSRIQAKVPLQGRILTGAKIEVSDSENKILFELDQEIKVNGKTLKTEQEIINYLSQFCKKTSQSNEEDNQQQQPPQNSKLYKTSIVIYCEDDQKESYAQLVANTSKKIKYGEAVGPPGEEKIYENGEILVYSSKDNKTPKYIVYIKKDKNSQYKVVDNAGNSTRITSEDVLRDFLLKNVCSENAPQTQKQTGGGIDTRPNVDYRIPAKSNERVEEFLKIPRGDRNFIENFEKKMLKGSKSISPGEFQEYIALVSRNLSKFKRDENSKIPIETRERIEKVLDIAMDKLSKLPAMKRNKSTFKGLLNSAEQLLIDLKKPRERAKIIKDYVRRVARYENIRSGHEEDPDYNVTINENNQNHPNVSRKTDQITQSAIKMRKEGDISQTHVAPSILIRESLMGNGKSIDELKSILENTNDNQRKLFLKILDNLNKVTSKEKMQMLVQFLKTQPNKEAQMGGMWIGTDGLNLLEYNPNTRQWIIITDERLINSLFKTHTQTLRTILGL